MKKEYISPEFHFKGISFDNVLGNSVEGQSGYIAPTDPYDPYNPPIIEDDDEMIWN